MAYAATETEYSELYQELNQTKLNSVIEYFNANWHSIRKEWVSGLKNESVTFNNRTNNRVESINQKLKGVMSKFSRLPQFAQQLLKILDILKSERDHRALSIIQKVPVASFSASDEEKKYLQLVTPYAFSYVVKQCNDAPKVILGQENNGSFDISHQEWCTVRLQLFNAVVHFIK